MTLRTQAKNCQDVRQELLCLCDLTAGFDLNLFARDSRGPREGGGVGQGRRQGGEGTWGRGGGDVGSGGDVGKGTGVYGQNGVDLSFWPCFAC